MARYPFYELAARRTEPDGSVRRCFRAADDSQRVLFVWQRDDAPVLHAQLLLGDETYVEWRASQVTSGSTNRASDTVSANVHPRHKGVRTLEPTHDPVLITRARVVLSDSDLPPAMVDALLARLRPTA